jgi:O-antigen ligase
MILSRVTPWALPCVVFLLIVVSPLSTMIDGRDIERLNFFAVADADGPGSWLSRLVSLGVLGVCLSTIGLCGRWRLPKWSIPTAVMVGYLVFFTTNSVLNSLFGTEPAFNRSQVYPLIVLLALYIGADEHGDRLLDAAKTALLAVMIASLLYSLVAPHATMRSYAPEVRLPFITFRYWGLGNSPNSTGPMALLLLLLLINRPFRSALLTAMGLAIGGLTLLLAQSQTAWAMAVTALPLYLIYRQRVGVEAIFEPPARMFVPTAILAGLAIIAAVVVPGLGFSLDALADDKAFTGRGQIWRLAVELYEQNPWFGYGPLAWETEFRARVGLPFAFTAHNQPLQSLSTAGMVGLLGWLAYAGALIVAAIALARPTRGLAPALVLAFPLIRAFSEATFEFKTILGDEFIMHMIVFIVLTVKPARPILDDDRYTASAWTRNEMAADESADAMR